MNQWIIQGSRDPCNPGKKRKGVGGGGSGDGRFCGDHMVSGGMEVWSVVANSV